MDRADGGEVLVTDTVRQLAGTMPDARFRDRGRVALKGFPERQRLHEVAAEATAARGAPRRGAAPGARRGALVARRGRGGRWRSRRRGGEEAVEVRANSVAILDPDDGRVVDAGAGRRAPGRSRGRRRIGLGRQPRGRHGDADRRALAARRARRSPRASPSTGSAAGPSGVWVADSDARASRA